MAAVIQKLAGKVALITGSTRGIGLAIARRLGLDGAKVVVSSRKADNVLRAVKSLEAEGINVGGTVCHVRESADRQKLVDFALQKFGGIDILVSNAGINPHYGNLLDVSEEAWDNIFDINVKAGFLLSKLVVPEMTKRGGGSIIFVSSITAYAPFQGTFAYGVSKTALLGLTKALAVSVGHANIRVNCIAPGIIKTEFSRALWDNPNVDKFYNQVVPLKRLGEPDDCSGTVSFLCSDDAAYITSECITIAGGINCRL